MHRFPVESVAHVGAVNRQQGSSVRVSLKQDSRGHEIQFSTASQRLQSMHRGAFRESCFVKRPVSIEGIVKDRCTNREHLISRGTRSAHASISQSGPGLLD